MTPSRHHRIDYIEIPSNDLERSKQFYSSVFGWQFNDYGGDYVGIQGAGPDDPEVGGFNPHTPASRGGVLVQMYSDDLDATLEAVTSSGGEVVEGPFEFPGGRRFHFLDPSGSELGVWTQQ